MHQHDQVPGRSSVGKIPAAQRDPVGVLARPRPGVGVQHRRGSIRNGWLVGRVRRSAVNDETPPYSETSRTKQSLRPRPPVADAVFDLSQSSPPSSASCVV